MTGVKSESVRSALSCWMLATVTHSFRSDNVIITLSGPELLARKLLTTSPKS